MVCKVVEIIIIHIILFKNTKNQEIIFNVLEKRLRGF